MIGSVFSPYYAWAGHRDAHDHVAFNVGLYGRGVRRWTLTERGRNSLDQSPGALSIGPSNARWEGDSLIVQIEERSAPLLTRVRGTIKLTPNWLTPAAYALDEKGRHFWHPIAPSARAHVTFTEPDMEWSGEAYFDSNWGTEMLEDGFKSWDWCRAALPDGAGIYYDAILESGEKKRLALRYDASGKVREDDCPQAVRLKPGPIWRVARNVPAAEGSAPKTLQMLEDTPFYTRSRITAHFDGTPATAIHESLDLSRFSRNWVRCLLPFRMPRRAG